MPGGGWGGGTPLAVMQEDCLVELLYKRYIDHNVIKSLLDTYMSMLSTLVILNCISLIPPMGIRSLPVVKNNTFFCRS